MTDQHISTPIVTLAPTCQHHYRFSDAQSFTQVQPDLGAIEQLHPRAVSALSAFLRTCRSQHIMVIDHDIEAWRQWVKAQVEQTANQCTDASTIATPVIYEPSLSLPKLLGTAVASKFREGILHRVHGGFLMIRVVNLLQVSGLWQWLKGILQTGVLSADDWYAAQSGRLSEQPPEITDFPVTFRLILVGEAEHFYALETLDSDVAMLVSHLAEFELVSERQPSQEQWLMSVLLARCQDALRLPVSASALAVCCEYAARLAEDADRLALRIDQLETLLLRAQDVAQMQQHDTIEATAVQQAIALDRYEAGRLEAEYRQAIAAGWLSIPTEGVRIGQINALTIYEVGRVMFGQPVKITAQTAPGNDGLVDIEKEAELAGPIHSKGMLIMHGYLRGRFMRTRNMALTASVVMEQTYDGVEGDSASAAETLALLSSIAQLPLRQDLAMTGSINQFGDIQAVGGINEKIEGFFRLCAIRGLTGTQGVLIPTMNQQSLMLAEEVRTACEQNLFTIYPINHLDEALAMMTGLPAEQAHAQIVQALEQMNPIANENE